MDIPRVQAAAAAMISAMNSQHFFGKIDPKDTQEILSFMGSGEATVLDIYVVCVIAGDAGLYFSLEYLAAKDPPHFREFTMAYALIRGRWDVVEHIRKNIPPPPFAPGVSLSTMRCNALSKTVEFKDLPSGEVNSQAWTIAGNPAEWTFVITRKLAGDLASAYARVSECDKKYTFVGAVP